MNPSELLRIVDSIHRDKNIDKEIVFEGIEAALVSAAKKHYGEDEEIEVHIDRETGAITGSHDGVPLALHPADRGLLANGGGAAWFGLTYAQSPSPTIDLTDGDELEVGNLHIQVLATPGHTPGGVCFYVPEEHALITGDTLFANSVGRTDLPGGDPRALTESLKRLLALPPETIVHPGHGPSSTLAQERQHNPRLKWIKDRP